MRDLKTHGRCQPHAASAAPMPSVTAFACIELRFYSVPCPNTQTLRRAPLWAPWRIRYNSYHVGEAESWSIDSMPPPPPTSISLRVKVPPGHIEGHDEFDLGSLAVATTIGAVRQHIQTIVPSRPAPARQRLLYGGRALIDNEQTLADALNTKRDPTQTEYVVHLLVKGDGQGQQPSAAGALAGHRRVASTPTPGQPPLPQAQPPLPQAQPPILAHLQVNPPGQPLPAAQGLQQGHYGQHTHALLQQNMMRQMQMQQQQHAMLGQMPGMQAMPHMPHLHHGMPGFGQAVQQGQQQRAAMGMRGVGPQAPAASPQPAAGVPTDGQQNTPVDGQSANGQPRSDSAPTTEAQHAQQQPQQHGDRPASGQGFHFQGIGPNGQRVHIHHHQQTFQLPHLPLSPPILGMPQVAPLAGAPVPLPSLLGGMPQPPQAAGPSALDRARENLAEMRRMLEEMRNAEGTTEEQRNRISTLQERTQSVNNYIDPFGLGPQGRNGGLFGNTAMGQRSNSPNPQAQAQVPNINPPPPPLGELLGNRNTLTGPSRSSSPPDHHWPSLFPSTNQALTTSEISCYLLSGPQGPHAILFSPEHGQFVGNYIIGGGGSPNSAHNAAAPPQEQQQPQNPGQQILDQIALEGAQPAANAAAGQNAAQQVPAQDPVGPFGPFLNHMWLLLRVLIFAYFLLGANLGWRRPAALLFIGIGFWMLRMGLFGEGAVLRRWWDGVLNGHRPANQQQQQQQGQQAAQGQAGPVPPAEGQQGAPRQPMPTPEQVAQRLIDERNQQRNARVAQLRELVRPVERVVALFVATLWPGVGEAHVQAREADERRRAEEEVAARRREEDARAAAEQSGEGEKKEGEGGSSSQVEGGEKGASAVVETPPAESAASEASSSV